MGRTRHALVAALTALLVVVGGGAALAGTPAPAAPLAAAGTGCAPTADGYAPPGPCQLLVLRAASECRDAAPVLDYSVAAEGTPNDTVTITWVNPSGPDVVQSGLPLSGQVLWPGTVVRDGTVVDWPGWSQDPSGGWTEHDAYDWTRPQVTVRFEVNPSAVSVVAYPPETAACANPVVRRSGVLAADPSRSSGTHAAAAPAYRSGVLAATGVADSGPLLGAVGLLLVAGTALVLTARRRSGR